MYIQPQTNIRILKNVPLDNTYNHTWRFASAADQAAHFQTFQKYALSDYTYQRVQRGRARVGYKAEDLYDCNYMMFQNAAFGSKWFYAFITSVEYINNVTSDINFEIDVMQSWYFDWSFEDCFVERAHTSTDEIGDNITAEPVATGEYIFANGYRTLSFADLAVIIEECDADTVSSANLYDGVFSGCLMTAYLPTDVSSIRTKIQSHVQDPDTIVNMYMIPRECLRVEVAEGGTVIPQNSAPKTKEFSYDYPVVTDTIGERGYVPKNHKLYTYPYNYLRVFTASGSSINTRFEFFNNHNPRFTAYCPITNPVQIVAYPKGYKGSGVDTIYPDENVTITGFPVCSWNNDTYKIYTAQNTIPNIMNVGNAAVSGAISGATSGGGAIGMALGAVTGALGQITNVISNDYKASIAADQYRGSSNTGGTITPAGLNNIYYGRVCVSDEYARMIDNFFTMYGYSIRKVEHPEISTRPNWNYIKTVGCGITGSVPADDMRRICEIHDAGITYWNPGVTLGDYSLDNAPTG